MEEFNNAVSPLLLVKYYRSGLKKGLSITYSSTTGDFKVVLCYPDNSEEIGDTEPGKVAPEQTMLVYSKEILLQLVRQWMEMMFTGTFEIYLISPCTEEQILRHHMHLIEDEEQEEFFDEKAEEEFKEKFLKVFSCFVDIVSNSKVL